MNTVRIPPTLRDEVGGEREVEADGDTVRELLDDLMSRFPALRAQLVEDDDIAPFVNVYVEGEDVRTRDGLDTEVRPGSTVILLPAMAGGDELGEPLGSAEPLPRSASPPRPAPPAEWRPLRGQAARQVTVPPTRS